jgi:hypothetical protein
MVVDPRRRSVGLSLVPCSLVVGDTDA